VPNQPKTPLRSFRVEDDVWKRAQRRAQREGTNVTAVIVEHLTEYGANEQPEAVPDADKPDAQRP
jgi:hypothetical protein